jgi:hypothetical protein
LGRLSPLSLQLVCYSKLTITLKLFSTEFIVLLFFLLIVCFYPGFNVETVEYKNISFTVWDVGGQDKVCKCFKL